MTSLSSLRLALLLLAVILSGVPTASEAATVSVRTISLIAPQQLMHRPVTRLAIDDTIALLRKGFPAARVTLNDRSAQVQLLLPAVDPARGSRISRAAAGRGYPFLKYPDQEYRWISTCDNGRLLLRLETPSEQGTSFALYGLLQERLGYRFIHPRQTIIPRHHAWPLPERFTWQARPRFDKRGFHLHTLHPTELAEQLNNPALPRAGDNVKEYLDWLARNGQNCFQFYLLRGVDRQEWPRHAREIVAYAHDRGILAGVTISVSMLQQQAFQAVTLLRPVPYRRQVDETLAWLFQTPWDFVSVEPTMGEYLPRLDTLIPGTLHYLEQQATGRYRTRLFRTTHVIRTRSEREGDTPPPQEPADGDPWPLTGILIHTVMCHSLTEKQAPVYGNRNLCFMADRAMAENRRRETWYWPESSYWVAYDNSVPLLILPYLQARWDDMRSVQAIGLPGHLTFSSGWEWGYWLVDWSIARWSWAYGNDRAAGPLGPLSTLFPDPRLHRLWQRALKLQEEDLKERELLRYLAVPPPFAEMPWPFNSPFQPTPGFGYRWLLHDAPDSEAKRIGDGPVRLLTEYAEQMETLTGELERETVRNFQGKASQDRELRGLAEELTRSLRVTALRARHRSLTLRALLARRGAGWWQPLPPESAALLEQAALVRRQALGLVRQQEAYYRYPVEQIARRRESLTAYRFGYLYPVSTLFFWEREEGQVRDDRFDAFYRNLWDFPRVLGLGSLFSCPVLSPID